MQSLFRSRVVSMNNNRDVSLLQMLLLVSNKMFTRPQRTVEVLKSVL